jgi:hypothetical protein
MMVLAPSQVWQLGLQYCAGSQYDQCSLTTRTKQLHAIYCSSPLDLADLWYDLTVTHIQGTRLLAQENTEAGFCILHISCCSLPPVDVPKKFKHPIGSIRHFGKAFLWRAYLDMGL